MNFHVLADVAAVIAILGTAVVFGTDTFCAVVMRPALAIVDDDSLVAVMGRVHKFGDQRMPVPGAIGLLATVLSAAAAALAGAWASTIAAGAAVTLLASWLVLYLRLSAPINRQLTAAAEAHRVLPEGRALQTRWDSVITTRAAMQGFALVALCVALLT